MRKLKRLWKKLPWWLEFGIIAGFSAGFFMFGIGIVWAIIAPIPAIDNFENRKVAESTKIFDRTGNIVLYDVHGQIRRTEVLLEEISPYIRNATIAIEDDTFYEHRGFRPLSFLRAAWVNLSTGSFSQGGSTITQQVVKNALLTQRKTIARKAEEIILALRLERLYSKDEILNAYLNETPYGGTIYGVEEATQYFFGKSAKDVMLAEAAYLAALPQAPTRFSPYGNNRDLLDARQELVLKRMLEHNFITEEEYAEAIATEVAFRDTRESGIKAPHFVFFIREYLEEKYGADTVAQGGLRVITTLDWNLQQKAEDVVKEYAPRMEANFRATNEGLVAVDPSSGQVLAMVGSRDYFETEIDGAVNVTLAHRQPGSSFKPFVYATAFKKGYTPETVVFDLKTQFSARCAPNDFSSTMPCYSPDNFDNAFKGPITFRNALAQSVNIPAVKVLYLSGITDSIKTAEDMGITTLADANRYGLTLVLGGGEVTLLELTGAYSVFASDGVKNAPTGILRIEDRSGKVLEEFESASTRVLDAEITRKISDILSDNAARTPEFGANSPLYFPEYDVAAKTGTTNDYRDVWIVGYTPGIAIGAWAGNNDNSPMERRIASFIIAPMWHEVMEYAIERYPGDSFIPPAPETGDLPPVLAGNWNSNPGEGIHDILHWINKDNPRSGGSANPWSDVQYERWEYPVALWAGQQAFASTTMIWPGDSFAPSNIFAITSPPRESVVSAFTPVIFTSSHPRPDTVAQVAYYLNGAYVGAAAEPPYSIAFIPQAGGRAELTAIAETQNGTEQTSIMFTIQ